MTRKLYLATIIIIVIILAMVAIVMAFSPKEQTSKLKVAASIFPIYDIARNIAGDKIEVVQIQPANISEHTFEPSIADQQKLTGSRLMFVVGLGLDSWANQMAADANDLRIVELHSGIQLLESEHHEPDPHYWLSIQNARQIANNITTELISLDPANAQYYRDNLANYDAKLIAAYNDAQLALAIFSSRNIITFHDAFSYLSKDLDLQIIATIEPFPGQTPSPEYIAAVGRIILENEVKVLFKEPQLSDEIVTALAADYGAIVKTLDPLGGVAGRDSYIANFNYNVETIAEALSLR